MVLLAEQYSLQFAVKQNQISLSHQQIMFFELYPVVLGVGIGEQVAYNTGVKWCTVHVTKPLYKLTTGGYYGTDIQIYTEWCCN